MGTIKSGYKPKTTNVQKLKTFLKREVKKVTDGKYNRLG
jgi:hypothetical protein